MMGAQVFGLPLLPVDCCDKKEGAWELTKATDLRSHVRHWFSNSKGASTGEVGCFAHGSKCTAMNEAKREQDDLAGGGTPCTAFTPARRNHAAIPPHRHPSYLCTFGSKEEGGFLGELESNQPHSFFMEQVPDFGRKRHPVTGMTYLDMFVARVRAIVCRFAQIRKYVAIRVLKLEAADYVKLKRIRFARAHPSLT